MNTDSSTLPQSPAWALAQASGVSPGRERGVCPEPEQGSAGLRAVLFNGQPERRAAVAGHGVDIGPGPGKKFYGIPVIALGRRVQRGLAESVSGLHVSAGLKKQGDIAAVSEMQGRVSLPVRGFHIGARPEKHLHGLRRIMAGRAEKRRPVKI